MSELTKIIIITITYNSEKTVERTIKSVVSQNYSNQEYWIIDGVSKDDTMKIVNAYKDQYDFIKAISEPDEGISDAFNKGIRLATGELIGFINSDDYLMPGAIRKIAEDYDGYSDVVYGDSIVRDEINNLVMFKKASGAERLKYEMPFIHQSSFARKDTYDKCGDYSRDYGICMDYDMMSRIRNSGGISVY